MRWDDEGNGEIYTERTKVEVAEDALNGNNLYVVENGREYRLVSLRERMMAFEPNKRPKRSNLIGHDLRGKELNSEAPSVPPNGTHSPAELHPALHTDVDDEDVNVVQAEVSATAGAVASALSAEPVKCKNLPYIVEEREVLQNIRIVKNVRNMFVK